MLNHFAAVIACGRTNGTPGAGMLPALGLDVEGNQHRTCWPPSRCENLLNVDYTKYMCCSTAAGYVVPSPGITFKGSPTIRYGVKGDS